MDKFWTGAANFSERVGPSMWSWFPTNVETLIIQQFIFVLFLFLIWNSHPSSSLTVAIINYVVYVPYSLLRFRGEKAARRKSEGK